MAFWHGRFRKHFVIINPLKSFLFAWNRNFEQTIKIRLFIAIENWKWAAAKPASFAFSDFWSREKFPVEMVSCIRHFYRYQSIVCLCSSEKVMRKQWILIKQKLMQRQNVPCCCEHSLFEFKVNGSLRNALAWNGMCSKSDFGVAKVRNLH